MTKKIYLIILFSISLHFAIAQPCTQQVIATSSTDSVCAGREFQLSASTIPGAAYTWSGPNGYSGNAKDSFIANADLSLSGDYVVTATIGSCVYKDTVSVYVKLSPSNPSLVFSNAPVCSGDTLSLTAVWILTVAYYVHWWGPNGYHDTGYNTSLKPNVSLADTGTYFVALETIERGCFSDTIPLQVDSIYPRAKLSMLVAPDTNILANDTVVLTAQASDTGTYVYYEWYFDTIKLPIPVSINSLTIPPGTIQGQMKFCVSMINEPNCHPGDTLKDCKTIRVATHVGSYGGSPSLAIYPNPNSGHFTIVAPEASVLYVADLQGRLVHQQTLSRGANAVDMPAGIPRGIYYGKVVGRNGTTSSRLLLQ